MHSRIQNMKNLKHKALYRGFVSKCGLCPPRKISMPILILVQGTCLTMLQYIQLGTKNWSVATSSKVILKETNDFDSHSPYSSRLFLRAAANPPSCLTPSSPSRNVMLPPDTFPPALLHSRFTLPVPQHPAESSSTTNQIFDLLNVIHDLAFRRVLYRSNHAVREGV